LEDGRHLILLDAPLSIRPQDHEGNALAGAMVTDALYHLSGAADARPVDADDEIARLQADLRGGAAWQDLLDHRAGHLLQPGRLLDLGRDVPEGDTERAFRSGGRRRCSSHKDGQEKEQEESARDGGADGLPEYRSHGLPLSQTQYPRLVLGGTGVRSQWRERVGGHARARSRPIRASDDGGPGLVGGPHDHPSGYGCGGVNTKLGRTAPGTSRWETNRKCLRHANDNTPR
jgi:hypothetical protein